MINTDVTEINKFLETQERSPNNLPMYRIIWSDSEFEYRKGVFNEFSDSGLFLRTIQGTRFLPKYNYINERWILEKWAPPELVRTEEIPASAQGDYIPVYCFEDGKGAPLPVTRKVVDFLLAYLRGTVLPDEKPTDEYLQKKEAEFNMSVLDGPNFSTSGITRNSIGYR